MTHVAVLLGWLALAAAVWLWAVPQQLERACWTGEWPFEDGCDDHPTRFLDRTSAGDFEVHLKQNAGDARSWLAYAKRLWSDQDAQAEAVVAQLRVLNPYHSDALKLELASAAKADDGQRLAAVLVTMAERGMGEAHKPLMALMQLPETQAHVLKLLTSDTQWLNRLFSQSNLTLSPEALLPFVSEGLRLDILKPQTVLALVEHLKNIGHPIDAYMLWLAQKGSVAEGIYNPSFDQRSVQKGFDWIWAQPTAYALVGARVSQVSATPRSGQMLEVNLTGRAALPPVLVQQTLVLLKDHYRLRLQVSTDRLKTTEGLVWGLYCANGTERWAETRPITSPQGAWEALELSFSVPATCGGVVNLRLEPKASWEVKAGMTGWVHFDDFELLATAGD